MAFIVGAIAVIATAGLANNVIDTFFGDSTTVNYILTTLVLGGAIVAGTFLYKSKSKMMRSFTLIAGIGVTFTAFAPQVNLRTLQTVTGGMLIGYALGAMKDPDYDPDC